MHGTPAYALTIPGICITDQNLTFINRLTFASQYHAAGHNRSTCTGDLPGGYEIANQGAENTLGYRKLAAEIAAAYVSKNSVPAYELPNLIRSVHGAFAGLASGSLPEATASAVEAEKSPPAQIRKSVRADGIVSFIDGKTYKTLILRLPVA